MSRVAEQSELAKNVICAIIAANGGALQGKLRLYKAFYYAHLYYWRDYSGSLTDYPIVRMPLGPGIDQGERLLQELADEGRIRITKEFNGPYTESAFSLTESAFSHKEGLNVELTEEQRLAIARAVNWVRDKTAAELSEETHLYSRSWNESADGDELNIYVDLMEEDEYARMKESLAEADRLLASAFS